MMPEAEDGKCLRWMIDSFSNGRVVKSSNYVFIKYEGRGTAARGWGTGGDMRACDVTCDRWGRVIISATRGAGMAACGPRSISNDAELNNISYFPLTHSCLRL